MAMRAMTNEVSGSTAPTYRECRRVLDTITNTKSIRQDTMTEAHRTPEYFRNSRAVRRIVNARLKRGDQVQCIGCGWPIHPDQRWDVGHIRDAYRGGDSSME